MLVIKPMGGPDDWHALFHEAGHAEHFAHTSASLPMEARAARRQRRHRGLGDAARVAGRRSGLARRRLDMPRADEFAADGATVLLYIVRRYCAKLLYETGAPRARGSREARARYIELLGDALRIEPMAENYLADVDSGFYASSYLRAWAFEAQMRAYLRERFGTDWFAKREAGSLLRELWSEGQALHRRRAARRGRRDAIELDAIADRVRDTVRPV